MTSVEMPDKAGCTLKLLQVNGKLYPQFPVENLKAYQSYPLRNDDVIICAYPKSGTHWLWEITNMLLQGKAQTVPFKKSQQMLEFVSKDDLVACPSPRVLNTHAHYDDLPRDAFKLKTKLVFVARNPKDVAVSLYNHHVKLDKYYQYSGTFHDWFHLFIEGKVDFGSFFDHTSSWVKVLYGDVTANPIHVVMYEDMKENPVRETVRLAEFLGVTLDPEIVEEIAWKCSFSNMAKDKVPFQDHAAAIYRKGEVGDWKNIFTVAESEALDNALEERLKDSKLIFRYAL
ncbi:hypothetical protein ACOMHN_015199 [Nucella lapillus]